MLIVYGNKLPNILECFIDCLITFRKKKQKKTLCTVRIFQHYMQWIKIWYYSEGKCSKTMFIQQKRIAGRMNDSLKANNFSSTSQKIYNLYKNLEFLYLHDTYRLELSKFMYKFEHNKLPKLSKNNFVEIINHHKYCARQAASSNFFLPGVDKRIAQKQLSFRAGVGNLRRVGQIRPVDTFYSARGLFSRLCIYPARDLFT